MISRFPVLGCWVRSWTALGGSGVLLGEVANQFGLTGFGAHFHKRPFSFQNQIQRRLPKFRSRSELAENAENVFLQNMQKIKVMDALFGFLARNDAEWSR